MFTFKPPAKINWFLKVCGLRNDGYHNIKSLIQKITLYDVLTFAPSENLTLITNLQIPLRQNLIYKAAVLLKKECDVKAGAKIHLTKKIPVSAGLGGGSSDAALTLIGLNKLWSTALSIEELCTFAERLGSDVPFFLHGPLAFVEGRGEKITDVKAIKPFDILLVKPPVAVSTHWAYEQLRKSYELRVMSYELKNKDNKYSELQTARLSSPKSPNSKLHKELTNARGKADNIKFFINAVRCARLSKDTNFFNDLESVTVKKFPVIAEIKSRLLREGAIFSMMSGSGPTVFGVFDSAEKAKNASKVFKDCWTAVVKTITEEN